MSSVTARSPRSAPYPPVNRTSRHTADDAGPRPCWASTAVPGRPFEVSGSRHQRPIGPTAEGPEDLLAMCDARLSCDSKFPEASQTDCPLRALNGRQRQCGRGLDSASSEVASLASPRPGNSEEQMAMSTNQLVVMGNTQGAWVAWAERQYPENRASSWAQPPQRTSRISRDRSPPPASTRRLPSPTLRLSCEPSSQQDGNRLA